MFILLHIIVALAGLVVSGAAAISPSKRRINVAYLLVLLTLVSGTYLTIVTKTHLLQACASGLVYLSLTVSSILFSAKRLKAADR